MAKRLRRGQIPFVFTPDPNTIIDGWLRRISPVEYVVHRCVMRFTWGYGKPRDTIAKSQIVELSGLSRSTVKRALETLEAKGLLLISGKPNRTRIYEALMPRWLDSGGSTHEPPAEFQRVAGEPPGGPPMNPSKERKKAALCIVK